MRTTLRNACRLAIGALALIAALTTAAAAATITIVNGDGANEGFNDPTPAAPVGGNPATTIGAQRLFVFQHAANIWGGILPSTVEIKINARFDGQTCDQSGAVLGSAGAGSSHRNFAGAPFPNTWYQQALANRIAGVDLNPAASDVNITFNSNLCNPGCVFCWYYGIDGNEGPLVELLPVVFHEIGHGLGFATITLAGVQMGAPNPGPHVYDRFLYDLDQDMHWHEMPSDAERGASAVNCQRLVWDGQCVTLDVPSRLGPKPVVRVNAPLTIAADYEAGMANFGPQSYTVTGDLALANDGSVGPLNSPTNACEPLINGAEVAGKIAIVDRGTCSRAIKVKNCQDAGAIGVVVSDTIPGCPALGMSGYDPSIVIPSVQVMADDGSTLKSHLAAGVNLTLTFDPMQTAGAREGKALVYTPTVFATGSSVSHWDVSAQPNLLMEPFITNSVSSDPDLAVNQLKDIGWFGTPGPCGPTATLLTLFTAEGREDGVLLRWQFGSPEEVVSVAIERSGAPTDSWSPVDAALGREGDVFTALDTSAEVGAAYEYRLSILDTSGERHTLGLATGRRLGAFAAGVRLAMPYPSPTAGGATVKFQIPRPEFVRLWIVDVAGRLVASLHEGMLPPGEHVMEWNGSASRRIVPPGVYMVTLRTSEGTQTQRFTVSR